VFFLRRSGPVVTVHLPVPPGPFIPIPVPAIQPPAPPGPLVTLPMPTPPIPAETIDQAATRLLALATPDEQHAAIRLWMQPGRSAAEWGRLLRLLQTSGNAPLAEWALDLISQGS